MDENKAIKIIRQEMGWESKNSTLRAFEKAINALEEIQQYRAIGMVEECRAAVEKQTAKKPDYEGDGYSDGQLVYDTWICPSCGQHYEVDYDDYDYCPECGQHIDKSMEQEGERWED